MSTTAHRLLPVEGVKTITVDDSLVLVDEKSGNYFGLNEIGAMIWNLLEKGHDEAAIVNMIVDEYDSDKQVIARDLQHILKELVDTGLVQ